jgi:hypothetical protein
MLRNTFNIFLKADPGNYVIRQMLEISNEIPDGDLNAAFHGTPIIANERISDSSVRIIRQGFRPRVAIRHRRRFG